MGINTLDAEEIFEKRLEQELYRDSMKWKVIRRMAIWSFVVLIISLIYFSTVGFYLDMGQADVISQFNGIIISLIGALMSIVLAFAGITYADKNVTIGTPK